MDKIAIIKNINTYYNKIKKYEKVDPTTCLENCRKAIEFIGKTILIENGRKIQNTITLQKIIELIQNNKYIDNKHLLHFKAVQIYGNYASHDQSNGKVISGSKLIYKDIQPCIIATDCLFAWYKQSLAEESAIRKEYMSDNNKFEFIVAKTSPIVIESMQSTYHLGNYLNEFEYDIKYHKYEWKDKILEDLKDGKLDMAIYNKERIRKFNTKNKNCLIRIKDMCSSMGGHNFYILVHRNSKWTNISTKNIKDNFDNNTKVCLPLNSDILDNFLYVFDTSKHELENLGVTLVDLDFDNPLSIFKLDKNMLLLSNQNVRFLAERNDEYVELINFSSLDKAKKKYFLANSVNSLVVSKQAIAKLKQRYVDVYKLADYLFNDFISTWNNKETSQLIREKFIKELSGKYGEDNSKYIVDKILFETYRIGIPKGL